MPRYYFDGIDGKDLQDQVGAELPDEAAARQEAILRAADDSSHQIEHYRGCGSLAVRDEFGQRIYIVAIKRGVRW